MKNREIYWDVLRCVAIFMVVFGHVASTFGMSWGAPYVSNVIIGINMPIFFVMSGYFSLALLESSDWKRLVKRILRYFVPLATTSVLFAVAALWPFHLISLNDFWGYSLRLFLFPKWFVWCLSICLVVIFACCRIRRDWKQRGICFLVAYALLLFVPSIWYMNYVRSLMPYMFFGMWLRKHDNLLVNNWFCSCCLVLFFGVIICEGNVHANGMSFYGVDSSGWSFLMSWRAIGLAIARWITGIIGVLGTIWVVRLFSAHFSFSGKLARLGTTTLGVYLLHHWILDRIPVLEFLRAPYFVLIVSVVLFATCHGTLVLLRRFRYGRLLFYGEWR